MRKFRHIATTILLTLGVFGAASAQSLATPDAAKPEFIAGGIGCGQGRTVYDYHTRTGEALHLKEWRLPSGAFIEKALTFELGREVEAVERAPELDEAGKQIGTRVVVRFGRRAAVYEARGGRSLIAQASSAELAIRFVRYLERVGAWHSAARRPTTH